MKWNGFSDAFWTKRCWTLENVSIAVYISVSLNNPVRYFESPKLNSSYNTISTLFNEQTFFGEHLNFMLNFWRWLNRCILYKCTLYNVHDSNHSKMFPFSWKLMLISFSQSNHKMALLFYQPNGSLVCCRHKWMNAKLIKLNIEITFYSDMFAERVISNA